MPAGPDIYVDPESGNDRHSGDSFALTASGNAGISGSTLTVSSWTLGSTLTGLNGRIISILSNTANTWLRFELSACSGNTATLLVMNYDGTGTGSALATVTNPKEFYIGGAVKNQASQCYLTPTGTLQVGCGMNTNIVQRGTRVRFKGTPAAMTTGLATTFTKCPSTVKVRNLITAVTVTTSASINASCSKTAHGLAIGDFIYIQGGTTLLLPNFGNKIWKVATVPDANTFTLENSVGTGAGSQSVSVRWCTNMMLPLAVAPVRNIEDGLGVWTASAGTTYSANTTSQQCKGYGRSIQLAQTTQTGLRAYKATGTINLSAYQQITVQIRVNAAYAAGLMTIRLCSDALGVTAVHTIPIPQTLGAGVHSFVWDNAAALSSSIQSVAFYHESSTTTTVQICAIYASKAAGDAECFTGNTYVGHQNSWGAGGDDSDGWYKIMFWDEQTSAFCLEQVPHASYLDVAGWDGPATLAGEILWRREAWQPLLGTMANASWMQNLAPATDQLYRYNYTFGWNRTNMATQDGQTFITGGGHQALGFNLVSSTGGGNMGGLDIGSTPRLAIAYFASQNVHVDRGFCELNVLQCSHSNGGFNLATAHVDTGNYVGYLIACSGCNVALYGPNQSLVYGLVTACGTRATSFSLYTSLSGTGKIKGNLAGTNRGRMLNNHNGDIVSTSNSRIDYLDFDFYTTTPIGNPANSFWDQWIVLHNCTFSEAASAVLTGYTSSTFNQNTMAENNCHIFSINHGNVTGTHIMSKENNIWGETESTIVRTGGGKSWKIAATTCDNRVSEFSSSKLPLTSVNAKAGVAVTVSCWVYRVGNRSTIHIVTPPNQVGFRNTTNVYTKSTANTATTGAWQQLTLTVTPTHDGQIDFLLMFWYDNTANTETFYIDDLTVSGTMTGPQAASLDFLPPPFTFPMTGTAAGGGAAAVNPLGGGLLT